jgi:hypothetical protein
MRNVLMLAARATRLADQAPKYEALSDKGKLAFEKSGWRYKTSGRKSNTNYQR